MYKTNTTHPTFLAPRLGGFNTTQTSAYPPAYMQNLTITANGKVPTAALYCQSPSSEDIESLVKKIEATMKKTGQTKLDLKNGLVYERSLDHKHATLTYKGQEIYSKQQVSDPITGKLNSYQVVNTEAIPEGYCLIEDNLSIIQASASITMRNFFSLLVIAISAGTAIIVWTA